MNVNTIARQKYFNGIAPLEESIKYKNLIKTYFKTVGMDAFGQIKFVAPSSKQEYDWNTVDSFINWASSNHKKVQYNTVINNSKSFPNWYYDLSPQDKLLTLESHVRKVTRRYKSRIHSYKLVNEAVREPEEHFLGTNLNKTILLTKIFKWAKEEDKEAIFLINDFGNFFQENIRNNYVQLIKDVQEHGGEIDAIGLQGHIWTYELPSDNEINNTLTFFTKETSLPIHITEFDLSYDNTIHGWNTKLDPEKPFTTNNKETYTNWFKYQGWAYKHFYDLCKEQGNVEELTYWGFVEESVPWERPGIALFDPQMKIKSTIDCKIFD